MKVLHLLAQYSKNGVLPLSVVKEKNYPLYKYFVRNSYRLRSALEQEAGIFVLNDIHTLKTKENIVLYIQYHFGDIVDLKKLREKHWTVYTYLCELGSPGKILEEAGFAVRYSRKLTDTDVQKELSKYSKENGIIKKMPRRLYKTIYNRAKRKGLNIHEYIKSLGFSWEPGIEEPTFKIDPKIIVQMREKGKTFSQIAEELGEPRSTVFDIYSRYMKLKSG